MMTLIITIKLTKKYSQYKGDELNNNCSNHDSDYSIANDENNDEKYNYYNRDQKRNNDQRNFRRGVSTVHKKPPERDDDE